MPNPEGQPTTADYAAAAAQRANEETAGLRRDLDRLRREYIALEDRVRHLEAKVLRQPRK